MPMKNPYGMDTDPGACPSAPASCTQLVHGYGDVTAEFLFVPEMVHPNAAGSPLTGYPPLQELLYQTGFADQASPEATLENAFVAPLVRFAPEADPTTAAYQECEPFFDAELRSINPEVVVALGPGAVRQLLSRLSTVAPESVTLPAAHGTKIRGRGFAIVASVAPAALDEAAQGTLIEALDAILSIDYRQTKGQRDP